MIVEPCLSNWGFWVKDINNILIVIEEKDDLSQRNCCISLLLSKIINYRRYTVWDTTH